ncbi:hypothetical protein [Pedobacter ginsengisoli]|uniref:hypothetical protein n=1 Tax=Pedobacter ginsengisoli TaxID=363852 RepID=UPI00254C028D|nr:hypothetical protein [Pedobacter ginsengisoli]
MDLLNPLDRINYLITKAPAVGTWATEGSGLFTYSAMIGDVHVCLNGKFQKYNTPTGAYLQASRIKAMMIARAKALKLAYRRRYANLRIINEHYMERKVKAA